MKGCVPSYGCTKTGCIPRRQRCSTLRDLASMGLLGKEVLCVQHFGKDLTSFF